MGRGGCSGGIGALGVRMGKLGENGGPPRYGPELKLGPFVSFFLLDNLIVLTY